MRKWLGLVLALLMMVLAAAGALAATNSVNDARNGVVYIEQHADYYQAAVTQEGELQWIYVGTEGSRGTGFFVGQENENAQYLVTCAHCVDLYSQYGRGEFTRINEKKEVDPNGAMGVESSLFVFFSQTDSVEAYLVDYDDVLDIAVLRIENPTDKRKNLKIKVPEDNMVSNQAYALGFPGVADLKDTVSTKNVPDLSVTTGTISRLITNSKTGRREIEMDVKISGGNSGGPLVNGNGSVLGICANGYDVTDAAYYAVSTAELIGMLKKNNVPYQLENAFPVALVAVMAAVVVLLIVVIIVVSRKKGGKGGKGGSGRVLVGEQGALAGKTFDLKRGQRLTVGRSTECQIRFPADTVGVSKVHCTILFDGEKVTVRDEKSTAGTYVDGNKVTPGTSVTLHRGQKLGIGSKTQILAVRSKK